MCRNFEPGKAGHLHLDSWAGRTKHKVTVLEETFEKYKIRFEDASVFGRFVTGVVRWVPKHSVTLEE